MSVHIEFNKDAVLARVKAANEKALELVTGQFIKDANEYCPVDTETLRRSAITASKPKEGLAIWDTPYAKKRYYTGAPSRDRNPKASIMWAQKAMDGNKKTYQDTWQKIIKQEV